MRRIAGLALHHEQRVPGLVFARGVAQQYMVHPFQVVVLGQYQKAGRHAFADFIEAATVLGIQRFHALADLLIQRVIGVAGLRRVLQRRSGPMPHPVRARLAQGSALSWARQER